MLEFVGKFNPIKLKGLDVHYRNGKHIKYIIDGNIVTNFHIKKYLSRMNLTRESLILKINNLREEDIPICRYCSTSRCWLKIHSLESPEIKYYCKDCSRLGTMDYQFSVTRYEKGEDGLTSTDKRVDRFKKSWTTPDENGITPKDKRELTLKSINPKTGNTRHKDRVLKQHSKMKSSIDDSGKSKYLYWIEKCQKHFTKKYKHLTYQSSYEFNFIKSVELSDPELKSLSNGLVFKKYDGLNWYVSDFLLTKDGKDYVIEVKSNYTLYKCSLVNYKKFTYVLNLGYTMIVVLDGEEIILNNVDDLHDKLPKLKPSTTM